MTKLSPTTLSTFTALAVVLLAPGLALAKMPSAQLKHGLGKPLMIGSKVVTITSGKVVSEANGASKNGAGTWVKEVINLGGGKEKVITDTVYSDGVSVIKTDNITQSGSTTFDDASIYKTTSAGTSKTIKDTTDVAQGNGLTDVSEVIINQQGRTNLSGTEITSSIIGGVQNVFDLTNLKTHKSEDLTYDTYAAGDAKATEWSGTNFNGAAVSGATLRTFDNVASGNYIDNSRDGHGTYTYSSVTKKDGQVNVKVGQTFADGAKNNTYTKDSDGTLGFGDSYVSATGKHYSAVGELYNFTKNGGFNGYVNQTDGYNSFVVGKTTAENFGFTSHLVAESHTRDDGAKLILNTETLVLGDAFFDVRTGKNYNGAAINSATLITGQQTPGVAGNPFD